MKRTYKYSAEDVCHNPSVEDIRVGDLVLAYTRYNVITGSQTYHISKVLAETGYPGNTDSSVRRFHGWRGTTNNISIYAHGVYIVDDVQESGDGLKIHIGNSDVKRDEE